MKPPYSSPESRLTALLVIEGPMTFRNIIAAHKARNWPVEPLRDTITGMVRKNVLAESVDIEYGLVE